LRNLVPLFDGINLVTIPVIRLLVVTLRKIAHVDYRRHWYSSACLILVLIVTGGGRTAGRRASLFPRHNRVTGLRAPIAKRFKTRDTGQRFDRLRRKQAVQSRI
jgi:hypothetical protein